MIVAHEASAAREPIGIAEKRQQYFDSSIWAAMERQNKPPPRGHWRQGRGLDGEMERSDWWRG